MTSPAFLDRVVYPPQATVLKIVTLAKDTFTNDDYRRMYTWSEGFELNKDGDAFVGDWGLADDVLERIDACLANGAPWFNEVSLVFGRRSGKTQLVAFLVAWRIWHLLSLGDPQRHYGMAATKSIGLHIYSLKYDQVMRDAFGDIEKLLKAAPGFEPFLGKCTRGKLTILTPAQLDAGAVPGQTVGLIEVLASPATAGAGRGASVGLVCFDEIAHLSGQGPTADSVALSAAVKPGLAQFGPDKLVIHASSPWEQTGALYESRTQALAVNPATNLALQPNRLSIQLCSWDLYDGWEDAHTIPMWPNGPAYPRLERAIITADDPDLLAERQNNPDVFAVEYEAKFRSSQFAYFTPDTVQLIFAPFRGEVLAMRRQRFGVFTYVAHADPSVTQANFALAIAHLEFVDGVAHIVFDLLQVWRPQDFGGRLHYPTIEAEVFQLCKAFGVSTFTMDQYNSAGFLDHLRDKLSAAIPYQRVVVEERTAHHNLNWRMAERFKMLAGQGRIHAPLHGLARSELEYLQVMGDRVVAPSSGHVRTKDCYDAMANVVYTLTEMHREMFDQFAAVSIRGVATSRPVSDPGAAQAFSRAGATGRDDGWYPQLAAKRMNPNRRSY